MYEGSDMSKGYINYARLFMRKVGKLSLLGTRCGRQITKRRATDPWPTLFYTGIVI